MPLRPRTRLICAGAALLGSLHAVAQAEELTFVSQGGAYQEAQSKAILLPAAKALKL
ncbi:hypothetical protein [Pseudomonas sp. KNUC1026]|uniref:hypothetical protein n=1 Tax=Pseudomonas sp. KNUC1026 TaxID=2893890 RepID=UPI001F3F2D8A|nr:hypothetical protein [Pseudomonas sp. KNUC1026]UFH51210.1 hypothetical protein LN139_09325 [Pseudomonas sp. KNUC1026]